MKMKCFVIGVFLLLLLIPAEAMYSYEGHVSDDMHSPFQQSDPDKVFEEIGKGLAEGEVSKFSQYFSQQSYLSIFTGINGYYSSSQSFYILEDFFAIHRPISFSFTNINAGNNPYATGTLKYDSKGVKKTAQVFISLVATANDWKISQFTIR